MRRSRGRRRAWRSRLGTGLFHAEHSDFTSPTAPAPPPLPNDCVCRSKVRLLANHGACDSLAWEQEIIRNYYLCCDTWFEPSYGAGGVFSPPRGADTVTPRGLRGVPCHEDA